ncbi:hypothetical protein C8R45DRAFT_935481 [Mycena sanguinolenta]|nr:hypothetical protein C8R45DRAFT_935481 [Mycena sanguinolenta]
MSGSVISGSMRALQYRQIQSLETWCTYRSSLLMVAAFDQHKSNCTPFDPVLQLEEQVVDTSIAMPVQWDEAIRCNPDFRHGYPAHLVLSSWVSRTSRTPVCGEKAHHQNTRSSGDRIRHIKARDKREATVSPPDRPGCAVGFVPGHESPELCVGLRCVMFSQWRLWDELELVLEAVHGRGSRGRTGTGRTATSSSANMHSSCLRMDAVSTAPQFFARDPARTLPWQITVLLRRVEGEDQESGGSFSLIRAYQRCTEGRLVVCLVQNIRVNGKSRSLIEKSGGEEPGDGRERLRERDQSPRTTGCTGPLSKVQSSIIDHRRSERSREPRSDTVKRVGEGEFWYLQKEAGIRTNLPLRHSRSWRREVMWRSGGGLRDKEVRFSSEERVVTSPSITVHHVVAVTASFKRLTLREARISKTLCWIESATNRTCDEEMTYTEIHAHEIPFESTFESPFTTAPGGHGKRGRQRWWLCTGDAVISYLANLSQTLTRDPTLTMIFSVGFIGGCSPLVSEKLAQ